MSLPYPKISELLHEGKVIPFLGAGVNYGQRQPPDAAWRKAAPFLPSGVELSLYLARQCNFPLENERDRKDLAKVASYYEESLGRDYLREELHKIFAPVPPPPDYAPCTIHEYLGGIERLRLVITTNYDRLTEQAFAHRPYYLVVHPTDQDAYGNQVLVWKHDPASPQAHFDPQPADPGYLDDLIDLETTTVIYKMHGTVAPEQIDWDSYVISEDDYIDFLSRMTHNTAIPPIFWRYFHNRSFLFLGYGLGDWNLRIVLRNVFAKMKSGRRMSWAIQFEPSQLEKDLWDKRNVNIYNMDINDFVVQLKAAESQQTT